MRVALPLFLLLASGCSRVWIDRALPETPFHDLGDTRAGLGVTYYEPMLVAIVSCGPDGSLMTQIATMPDPQRPRTVRWRERIFGSANPNVTLGDGWRLESIGGSPAGRSDSTVIDGLRGTVVVEGGWNAPQGPGIYRLEWSGNAWHVTADPLLRMAACSDRPTPETP